jgi:hypothetical protein
MPSRDSGRPAVFERRRFLAALSAAATPLVAGCSGGDDGGEQPTSESTATATTRTETTETTTSGAPAVEFAEIAVSPSTVRQFQPATVEVTAQNDGGAAFEGDVVVQLDGSYLGSTSVDIGPGETTTASVEFTAGRVGDYPLTASAQTPDRSTHAQRTEQVSVAQYPEHEVAVDGTDLVCGDGTAYFGGTSLANAFAPEHNRPSEAPMAEAFETLSDLGVPSARIWGFAPSWADISSMPAPGEYDDAWFDFFDRVVVEAKKRDIRLFVPLINGNPAYGPITEDDLSVNVPQFVRWADDAETRNDFFDSEDCMRLFEGWVERLLTHENHLTGVEYRDDPTIAMWELGNEIQRSPPQVGQSIRPWIEQAGAFVKSLDDTTLLTTGSYGHQGRNAFVDEANADPIDVVSIHYYPGPEHYDMPESEVVPTLESTVQTVEEEIGKPLYVGEYNWGVGPEDSAPYTERTEWVGRLHQVMDDAGIAATNFHTVAVEERPTSFHKPATVYAPKEAGTLDEIRQHAQSLREQSDSACLSADE